MFSQAVRQSISQPGGLAASQARMRNSAGLSEASSITERSSRMNGSGAACLAATTCCSCSARVTALFLPNVASVSYEASASPSAH